MTSEEDQKKAEAEAAAQAEAGNSEVDRLKAVQAESLVKIAKLEQDIKSSQEKATTLETNSSVLEEALKQATETSLTHRRTAISTAYNLSPDILKGMADAELTAAEAAAKALSTKVPGTTGLDLGSSGGNSTDFNSMSALEKITAGLKKE